MLLESILAVTVTIKAWHILLAISILSFLGLKFFLSKNICNDISGIGDAIVDGFYFLIWVILNLIMWLIFFIII